MAVLIEVLDSSDAQSTDYGLLGMIQTAVRGLDTGGRFWRGTGGWKK